MAETTKTHAPPEREGARRVVQPLRMGTDRRRVGSGLARQSRPWLQLQRDAGNQAVNQLFSQERPTGGDLLPAVTTPVSLVAEPAVIEPPSSSESAITSEPTPAPEPTSAPEPTPAPEPTATEDSPAVVESAAVADVPTAAEPTTTTESPTSAEPAPARRRGSPPAAPERETRGRVGADVPQIGGGMIGGGGMAPATGAPARSPAVDTSSAERLLESLAAAAPSAFPEAVALARAASGQVQQQEKGALQASFPQIERPTGLPRQARRLAAAPVALRRGEAPAPESPGSRAGAAPETRRDVAVGPIPGAQVSTAAAEPGGENEGSWWDWLVNRVRAFLSQLPISDTGVSTYAGTRPQVDLTGEADPNQNQRQQQAADVEMSHQRATADGASLVPFGENDIYPTVPTEALSPSYRPAPPTASMGRGGVVGGGSDQARALFDQGAAPWLRQHVQNQVQQRQQNRMVYEQQSAEIRASGQRQIADETVRVRGEQEGMQEQARADVAAQRESWREENLRIQQTYATQSATRRQEVDQQIQNRVRTAETEADTTMTRAENRAEQERVAAEAKAAAKRREAENRPRSWWDRVKGAVSDAFAAIKRAINDIFDALRKLVKQIIEAAKVVVRGIIEAARVVVVGLIRSFGAVLKGLVTVALAAFPEAAARARDWIDRRVNSAVDAVNAAAEILKEAADTILDWVGEALDTALSVLQAAFNLALDILEFLTLGLVELLRLLQKLIELLAQIGPMMRAIWDLIQNPEPAIEAIKQFLGGLIAQVPAQARAIARGAITFSDPPANHWQGIWEHLEPKLDYLATNWWEVIKQTAWFMIWPFAEDSPIWKEGPELWDTIGEAFDAVWAGDFNRALDKYLRVQQLIVNIANLFYGWVFLGLVIGYGIAGGIAGVEVGVVPGIIAGMGVGAGIAADIGLGLLAATAAAEGAVLAKAGYDLIFGSQTPQENDNDYEDIASSGLVLAIIGALLLLGSLASRFGKAILSRAGRVVGAAVRALLGPRAAEVLEAALNRIRLKVAEIQARLRGEGRFKFKNSPVTAASYEGPARRLHPERFDEIITELDRNGIEINVRDAGDPWTGSYQPGRSPGEPGQMNVHRDVDLRTLEHEYKHFVDDRAGGYPGLRHYLENPEVMWEMERAAYDREIELVNADGSLSVEDRAAIVRELEAAKARERAYYLGSEE